MEINYRSPIHNQKIFSLSYIEKQSGLLHLAAGIPRGYVGKILVSGRQSSMSCQEDPHVGGPGKEAGPRARGKISTPHSIAQKRENFITN